MPRSAGCGRTGSKRANINILNVDIDSWYRPISTICDSENWAWVGFEILPPGSRVPFVPHFLHVVLRTAPSSILGLGDVATFLPSLLLLPAAWEIHTCTVEACYKVLQYKKKNLLWQGKFGCPSSLYFFVYLPWYKQGNFHGPRVLVITTFLCIHNADQTHRY